MPQVGQNLWMSWSTGKMDYKPAVKDSVYSWYNEYKVATKADINKCCPNLSQTGHFTQVVKDVCGKIGCAVIQGFDGKYYRILIACNYEGSNLIGVPIYTAGPAASKCATKSTKYPGLCA
jgi:hypothetical protein